MEPRSPWWEKMEFEWILHQEVHSVLTQLHTILLECVQRFPVTRLSNDNNPNKMEKFVLSSPPDVKCVVTLAGDSITSAEINVKVQRQQMVLYRTTILSENPWKLQQIQDAVNHLQQAIRFVESIDKDYTFKTFLCRSSDEVLHLLGNILSCLQRGRTSLIVPRKKTIDDLLKSRNMKTLTPPLPEDLAISFYVQSHKLVFALYQLSVDHGVMKFDPHQAECSVPWLNEVLVLFTVALQQCQQLKDKICIFSQYKDLTISSRPASPVKC
ncbi:protein rogdi isoform X2 [Bacillus rossius redtenbacheri]|uniref:protein rogdi isoform X2 n=1 Tax=Bacillus rossius redtenbacheri TaxID=93214 RepID=UPI002FDE926B